MPETPALETRAGDLSVVLADSELRDIHVGGHPALDLVYVAVRDPGWGTVPGEILSVATCRTTTGTTTEVEVRHAQGEIAFHVRFVMDGVAQTGFDANRIGFCLLHPQALKGLPVRISGPSGALDGTFPEQISPDPVFSGFDRMACCVAEGAELEIRFDGEVFETEDHRNWSDPGWKTYCTPLAAPRPTHLAAGQHVTQSVELRAHVASALSRRGPRSEAVTIRIGPAVIGTVPALGLGTSGLTRPAPATCEAVRALRPAHLHVELEDGTPWPSRLKTAEAEATALGTTLDVAVVAAPERVALIADRAARTVARLGRVSVFSPARHHTGRGTVTTAREVLRDAGRDVPVGGGSRAHFAELNRGTFDAETWDFVTYGLTPQVHHSSDGSILATAAAIADGLEQARSIAGGLPVVVGPVTLRPRFNAAAERPDPLPPSDDGPDVDDRQHTPLAATYLAAAVSRLAGADAVTVFRTSGRRGVVTSEGEPAPAAAVVSALTSLAGAAVRTAGCSDPAVVVLAVTTADGIYMLVTNLAPEGRRLELDGAAVREATVLGARGTNTALDPSRLMLPPLSTAAILATAT
jgi:D-apionolactonase